MGYQAEVRVRHARQHVGAGSLASSSDFLIECVFFACYCSEFLLRLVYWRLEFFHGHEGKLNIFDAALLMVSLTDLVGLSASNLMVLRIVKLAHKACKVMRMGRAIRFCKEIRQILVCFMKSLRTFLWSMLTMGLMMYIMAVILVQAIAEHLENTVKPSDPELE